jgi:hypothetical protein
MSNDIDDLLAGGSASFKFETIGDTIKGRIISAKVKQQTDLDTGQPKTFSNGDPMNQLVVTIEHEDGEEYAVYLKGGKYEPAEGAGKSGLDAIRDALNGEKLTEGGTIAIQFSGLGKKTKAAYSAPKLFVAQYKPPVASVAVGDLI